MMFAVRLLPWFAGVVAACMTFGSVNAQSAPPATIAAPTQASGEAITVEADGKRKINLAGRQRMLSQYMAKAVCFAALGVDKQMQLDELRLAHHLFERTQIDLRDGSNVQQMLPELDEPVNLALDDVERLWFPYGKAVLDLDLPIVVSLNNNVLTKANDVVTLFQKKYGSANVAPEIAAALNISGRQRMLTQKSSKEFCLIASGLDAASNRTNLKATIALFETSLKGLREGDAALGLKAAQSEAIATQIGNLETAWKPLHDIFLRTSEGATAPSAEEIATVSRKNVAVMETANALVSLYEKAPK